MSLDPNRFLDAWHEQADGLLEQALRFLSALADSPLPDGQLGEWVRQLEQFRFGPGHLTHVLALLDKADPLLVEAGIKLSGSVLAIQPDAAEELDEPLARTLADPAVDPWLAHALVRLLARQIGPHLPQPIRTYQALVEWLERPAAAEEPTGRAIQRTMFIDPRAEALELFEQQALQTLAPTRLIEIVLPVLERKHATRGWTETFQAILNARGLDPRARHRYPVE